MTISEEMRLALRRQLDAEDDLTRASDTLEKAYLDVQKQADIEGLFKRDIDAMFEEVRTKGTDELLRDV